MSTLTIQQRADQLMNTPVEESAFAPRLAALFALDGSDERNDWIVTVFVRLVRSEKISSLSDLISNEPMDDFLTELWEKLLKQTWRRLAKSYAYGTVLEADHFLADVHMKLRKVIWKFDPRRSHKPGGPFAKLKSWIWSLVDRVFIDVLRAYKNQNRSAMQQPLLTPGMAAAAQAAAAIRPDVTQAILSFVFLVLNRVNEGRKRALEAFLGVSLKNAAEVKIGRAWKKALRGSMPKILRDAEQKVRSDARQNGMEDEIDIKDEIKKAKEVEIEKLREQMRPFTTNEILAFLLWVMADLTLHEVKMLLEEAGFQHSSIGFIKKNGDAVRNTLETEVVNDASLSQDLEDQFWDIKERFSMSDQSRFKDFIERARNAKHCVRDILGVLLR